MAPINWAAIRAEYHDMTAMVDLWESELSAVEYPKYDGGTEIGAC
jgi:hypothetical protein